MFLLGLLACNSVPPGSVVLQVNLTAEEATRYSAIRGGRYYTGPNTDYYMLPTMEQRSVWSKAPTEGAPVDESITFAGRDGQAVNADFGIGYQLKPTDDAIIQMVRTYGTNLDQIIDGRVRDSTRNALNLCASQYTVEQIYGDQKGNLMACAEKALQDEYNPNGLLITRLTLNSAIRLPAKVKEAMEDANAATQRAIQIQNEVASTEAEGKKRIAAATAEAESVRIAAEAQANANKLLSESITPTLLELKRLEAQKAAAEKWNGRLPTTILGGGTIPMIQLPETK